VKITMIMLGGARRVTLAEQCKKIINSVGIDVDFLSLERDDGFYPIAQMGETISAPKFLDARFDSFLNEILLTYSQPLIVPCMDSALPALSRLRGLKFDNAKVVAPTKDGAEIALNKQLTDAFCKDNCILHPASYRDKSQFPKNSKLIAKPLQGFGGKGIYYIDGFDKINDELFDSHILQDFIIGPETTHDLYITNSGEVFASSRDRLAVIDGEVDHCVVRLPTQKEHIIFNKIAGSKLFYGPLTVQTINSQDNVYLIEINARFGGGVTASIEAGFPGVELLIEDTFGIKIPHRKFKKLEMKRARRDFYRYINSD
jgi:carbamoyl-phosphate synthase large subunit